MDSPAPARSPAEACLLIGTSSGEYCLCIKGNWLEGSPHPHPKDLTFAHGDGVLRVDCTQLEQWDSTLLVYILLLKQICDKSRIQLELNGLPSGAMHLVEQHLKVVQTPPRHSAEAGWLEKFGQDVLHCVDSGMEIIGFLGAVTHAMLKMCVVRARIRFRDIWEQTVKTGPLALFIISMIGFLMGLILAFIGAIPLKWFHAEIYTSSLIGIGMLRLMGAVMTGTVMAGRTGASFAAELGTMQVNEEIDALYTAGISPIEFLVLPRCLALTLLLPLLCLYGDLMGIIGGTLVGIFYLDLSLTEFITMMRSTTGLTDFWVGEFTALVFGWLISLCGCLRGMQCGRSAEAVGQAATSAVVSSLVCMIIATAIITVITVTLGI